jgi:hypothetical protein
MRYNMKFTFLSFLLIVFATSPKAGAGVPMTLTYESSTSVNGPWTTVDPATVQISPTGAITVDTPVTAGTFFRMRIAANGAETALPVVTLAQVPPEILDVARDHLTHVMATDSPTGEAFMDAEIAPFATPLMDTGKEGAPTHYEFRLIRRIKTARTTAFRKFDSDETGITAAGYLICSANRNDLPVVEFSTEGESPVAHLLRKCNGVPPARVLRYGAGFWVAENARGELIANHGGEPFRLPDGISELTRQSFAGRADTETGQEDHPPRLDLKPSGYRDYNEFKADYETNQVYKLLRDRRAAHARPYWDAIAGITPTVFNVAVGASITVLPTLSIDAVIVDLEDDERAPATVSRQRTGLKIDGNSVGRMGFKTRVGETISRYLIDVQARAGVTAPKPEPKENPVAQSNGPHWKISVEAYAGSWSDQMRWWQLKDPNWCQAVGCGPLALAMLFGYWDHQGVPSAFYTTAADFNSLSGADAPQFLNSASKKAHIHPALDSLHDLCDVICDPFSDSGATLPSDEIEGFFGYIYPVASKVGIGSIVYGQGNALVGYSYDWAYDFWGDDWDGSGTRVANGIKKSRPGVVGLGWLWHYVVAYGYIRKDYVVTINGSDYDLGLRQRFFKCNEGWGEDSAHWYSAYDVFLGLSANLFQKTTPKQP